MKIFISIYKKYFSASLKFFLGGGCRFEPTCSVYAHKAISKYGVIAGTWLALKRIMRCHPLSKGGYDPVL